jgi:hypothetical protein
MVSFNLLATRWRIGKALLEGSCNVRCGASR